MRKEFGGGNRSGDFSGDTLGWVAPIAVIGTCHPRETPLPKTFRTQIANGRQWSPKKKPPDDKSGGFFVPRMSGAEGQSPTDTGSPPEDNPDVEILVKCGAVRMTGSGGEGSSAVAN